MKSAKTIDDYIRSSPEASREKLKQLRSLIHEMVPNAGEKVSYGIATFTLNDKYFIYIAGYKDHVSIHPASDKMQEEIQGIAAYRTGKGTLQFPLDKPLPIPLIRKVIKFRVNERKAEMGKY